MARLQRMQTFVRVVEAGSFSAVARELATTQSAISKQVASLERHLGAKLLVRTTRSLSLTDDGRRFFEEARRLVSEFDQAEAMLRRGEQRLSGWLRVAASVGYGRRVLLPQVQSFLNAHPSVKIDFKLHDGFIDLIEQGVDVAVRIGDLVDSSLVARQIGKSYRTLAASRRYLENPPNGAQRPRAPEDLLRHNCIVYTELASQNNWEFIRGDGSRARVRVEGNLQTNSSEVVREAGLSGMGICYAPSWLFADEIKRGEIEILLGDWRLKPIPIHAVSPAQRKDASKTRAFIEHLVNAKLKDVLDE